MLTCISNARLETTHPTHKWDHIFSYENERSIKSNEIRTHHITQAHIKQYLFVIC